MSHVLIREATLFDAAYIVPNSSIATATNASAALSGYIAMSDRSFIGLIDGEIVCIWGVMRQSLLSDRGYLWLLTTLVAENHAFLLIRYSQRIIEKLLNNYRILTGECLVNDAQARRWMKLLGAEFSTPEGKTIPFQIVGKNG